MLRDTQGHILICNKSVTQTAELIRIAVREGVDLRNANFSGLDLSEMDLSNLDLSFANFQGANLTKADLRRSLLRRSNFCLAQMKGSNLSFCDVRGATFTEASFDSETSFRDVIYLGTEFEAANLPKVSSAR